MDRREHDRYALWLPVQLDTPEVKEAMAVSHDASRGGILLVVGAPLALGTRVTLTATVPVGGPKTYRIPGTIVRSEPNSDDPDSIWPHRVGIEFDEPQPELERELRDFR